MTIRLFDIQDQARYADAVDQYEEQSRKASTAGGMGIAWPVYPKQPEPFINSRDDKAEVTRNANLQPIAIGGGTRDLPVVNTILDYDGNSQQDVKGYESNWTCDESAPTTPFSIKGK